MASKNLVAGIDIGSSAIKWAVMDLVKHEIVKSGRILYPKGTFRVGIVDIRAISRSLIRTISIIKDEGVKYAGLSCMAPILILVDDNSKPLTGIPYNSLIGSEFIPHFNTERIRKVTLNMPNTQMFAQKLKWIQKNDPETLKKGRWLLDLNGYVMFLLSGGKGIPAQDMNTALEWGLFDPTKKEWFLKMVEGIDLSGKLPDLVSPEYTVEINGVNLTIGTVDTVVSALGALGMDGSKAFVSNGSTLCAGFVSDFPILTKTMYNDLYFNGKYLVNGCNSQYYGIIDWAEKALKRKIDVESVDLVPRATIFVPYLEGERCPLFNTDIRGGFYGIDKNTNIKDIIAAIVHSLGYLGADMLENLRIISPTGFSSVISGGGLAKENIGLITASLTGVKYETTEVEPATLGAIFISLKGNNLIDSYPNKPKDFGLKIKHVIKPDVIKENHSINYKRFIAFRDTLIKAAVKLSSAEYDGRHYSYLK